MTGKDLFDALRFVDERYIAEAESATLGRNTPWMKWVSLAACLCILITGVYAYNRMQFKGASESMAAPEAAAPEAMPEAAPEEAPEEEYAFDREWEEALPEAAPEAAPEAEAEAGAIPPYPAEEELPAGELQHISYARLRVTNIDEGSFEAIVEETDADTNLFEEGMQVTVMVDSTKVPGADAEVQNDLTILHTDAQIQIEDGAYDAGIGTLYVSEVIFLCRDDH